MKFMLYFSWKKWYSCKRLLYLMQRWKIKRIYHWIYCDVGDDVNELVKENYLELIKHLFWESYLSCSTSIVYWVYKDKVFLRSKNPRKVKIGDITFISNNILEIWEYKEISQWIFLPTIELKILENLREYSAHPEKNYHDIRNYIKENLELLDEAKLQKFSQNEKLLWAYKTFLKIKKQLLKEKQENINFENIKKFWERVDVKIAKKIDNIAWFLKTLPNNFWIPFNDGQIWNFSFWDTVFANRIEWTVLDMKEVVLIVTGKSAEAPHINNYFILIKKIYWDILDKKFTINVKDFKIFTKLLKTFHFALYKGIEPKAWEIKWNLIIEWNLKYLFQKINDLDNNLQKALLIFYALQIIKPFERWNYLIANIFMNAYFLESKIQPIIISDQYFEQLIHAFKEPSNYINFILSMIEKNCQINFKLKLVENPLMKELQKETTPNLIIKDHFWKI